MQKAKLDRKLAKIEDLQRQKEERRNIILERRYSKSPCGFAQCANSSIIQPQQQSNTNHHQSLRTPQPPTPCQLTRNDNFNQSVAYQSMFYNYTRTQNSLSKERNQTSASRHASSRITENNTPVLSSRAHYDAYLSESFNHSQQQASTFHTRKHSTSKNEMKSSLQTESISHSFIVAPQLTINYNSTSNLFRKTSLKQSQAIESQKSPMQKSIEKYKIEKCKDSSLLSSYMSYKKTNNESRQLGQPVLKNKSLGLSYAQLNQKRDQRGVGAQRGKQGQRQRIKQQDLEPIVEDQ